MILSYFQDHVKAQKSLKHFYLKIDGDKAENFEIEYGMITYRDDYYPKKNTIDSIKNDLDFISVLNKELNNEDVDNQLNVFIHGIWADSKFAWEQMIQNISEDVYDKDSSSHKVLLSVIWDSSLIYGNGVEIARRKGDYLAPFLNKLVETLASKNVLSIQCHSMGNRIFQHMLTSSKLMEQNSPKIDHYISIAADLENDIFLQGKPLEYIGNAVRDITIYMHNNDRTLGMSKVLNKTKRLGLHGPEKFREMPENFRVINVSVVRDNDDFTAGIGNHRYFYTSPTVREDLYHVIWKKDFQINKEELDAKRHYKLLEKKEEK